jgi:hypothetical protein
LLSQSLVVPGDHRVKVIDHERNIFGAVARHGASDNISVSPIVNNRLDGSRSGIAIKGRQNKGAKMKAVTNLIKNRSLKITFAYAARFPEYDPPTNIQG